MPTPLLSIQLIDGDPEKAFARVRITDGRRIIGQCYVMTAELMKCLAGQMTPCFLTFEEADEQRKKDSRP